MLTFFRNRATRAFYEGERVREFDGIDRKQAAKRFAYLEAATSLDDLRMPPSNRLEALKGDRAGQFSLRINRQWRICFTWTDNEPRDIEITKHYGD